MKKIISTLIMSAAFLTACTNDITLTPGISFITPEPEVLEETAIFRVIGQPFSSVDSLTIPIVIGGTAQRGTDYEISADHFVLSKESLMDSIVVSTKLLGTGRTINLSLQIPEGFGAGKYTTSELRLQDKFGFLSFDASKSLCADSTNFIISLCDSSGISTILTKETAIGISVNTEKSTAVEGVDFVITSASNFNISAGMSFTTFGIVPLNQEPREGKDKIVLNLASDYRFEMGEFPELELTIIHQDLKNFEGNWMMESLKTDQFYFEEIWGEQCSGYNLIPAFSSTDFLSVSFLGARFAPSFGSGFGNYFTGMSEFNFEHTIKITDVDGNTKDIQLISVDNTNRYFSKDETSEDSQSLVGIHTYTDDVTNRQMLDLYILDYTSKSFMPELITKGAYASEKPVAATPGLYLSASFTRF